MQQRPKAKAKGYAGASAHWRSQMHSASLLPIRPLIRACLGPKTKSTSCGSITCALLHLTAAATRIRSAGPNLEGSDRSSDVIALMQRMKRVSSVVFPTLWDCNSEIGREDGWRKGRCLRLSILSRWPNSSGLPGLTCRISLHAVTRVGADWWAHLMMSS